MRLNVFLLFSGRTSRLEIRKLLSECLFWRCQRTQIDQNEIKYPPNLFLFDEDDDTDRSNQGQGTASYSALGTKLPQRQNYLTPKSSTGNYSLQPSQTSNANSVLNCCGFTINLSHKHSNSFYTKSTTDDFSTRRSIKYIKPTLPISKSLCLQSSISSDDRIPRQQKTVCYRSTNSNRPITRRRAATVVHCSQKTAVPTVTTLTNKLSIPSISKEKQSLSPGRLSPTNDISSRKDGCPTNINRTEPAIIIIQTDYDEVLSPASIIETC